MFERVKTLPGMETAGSLATVGFDIARWAGVASLERAQKTTVFAQKVGETILQKGPLDSQQLWQRLEGERFSKRKKEISQELQDHKGSPEIVKLKANEIYAITHAHCAVHIQNGDMVSSEFKDIALATLKECGVPEDTYNEIADGLKVYDAESLLALGTPDFFGITSPQPTTEI